MAPAPKLDYMSTHKRVRANIRDNREIQSRDLDILMNRNKDTFADIIDKMEENGQSVDAKYHRAAKGKGKGPMMPRLNASPLSIAYPPLSEDPFNNDQSPFPQRAPKRKIDLTAESPKPRKRQSAMVNDTLTTEAPANIWTGKQSTRFKLAVEEVETISDSAYGERVAIGLAKHDPEPKRIIAAGFNSARMTITAINISSDGRQFNAQPDRYETIDYNLSPDGNMGQIINIVDLRIELKDCTQMREVRTYVWNELMNQGVDHRQMGWSDANDDCRRFPNRMAEMAQLKRDMTLQDPCGYTSYRNNVTGAQLIQTALQCAQWVGFEEADEMRAYMANPPTKPEEAIKVYNHALNVITRTLQNNSVIRLRLMEARVTTFDVTNIIKLDMPFIRDPISNILNGQRFELPEPPIAINESNENDGNEDSDSDEITKDAVDAFNALKDTTGGNGAENSERD
jgi:hypothetical protein